jgi:hypothetical protein
VKASELPGQLAFPTLADARKAGDDAQQAVFTYADSDWVEAIERCVRELESGTDFLPEQIVLAVAALGYETSQRRAVGPVISRLARAGVIRRNGTLRPSRFSHGSLKPVWRRV